MGAPGQQAAWPTAGRHAAAPPPALPSPGLSSAAQALAALHGALRYLAAADPTTLTVAEQAECLRGLQRADSMRIAAQSSVLAAFEHGCGPGADGHPTARAWLRWQARLTGPAASTAVAWSRRLTAHPAIGEALASGTISESWARQLCDWTDLLPESARGDADLILLTAAAAGAALDDLAGLAEELRARTATPDAGADPPPDRALHLDLHYRGAGRLRGDLTPRCAAAIQAILDALGKKQGPGDARTRAQRDHDALEEACRRLIAAGMVPDRAGQPTRIQLHLSLDDLLGRGADSAGSDPAETARPRLHPDRDDLTRPRPGRYTGPGPMARPGDLCDASIEPVVTGHVDHDLLARLAAALLANGTAAPAGTAEPTSSGPAGPAEPSEPAASSGPADTARTAQPTVGSARGTALADQYARDLILRGAVALLSGPGGLASRLRTGTLTGPAGTISLPLDVGTATDTTPPHLRRAVWLRDQHCGFPGCESRQCQVHHTTPVSEGGTTRLTDLVLGCSFHHLIAIHEWGWTLLVNPDGTKTATSPDGRRILHSHSPPHPA